jgi:hypothetical protein
MDLPHIHLAVRFSEDLVQAQLSVKATSIIYIHNYNAYTVRAPLSAAACIFFKPFFTAAATSTAERPLFLDNFFQVE